MRVQALAALGSAANGETGLPPPLWVGPYGVFRE